MPVSTYTPKVTVEVKLNRAKTRALDGYLVNFKGREQLVANSYLLVQVNNDRTEQDVINMFGEGEVESVSMK